MIDVRRIKHKGLKLLWQKGDERRLRVDWVAKSKRILAALNAATGPDELNLPGFGWNELEGKRKGCYSVKVSGNWRITYRWDSDGPFEINLEDYHGK